MTKICNDTLEATNSAYKKMTSNNTNDYNYDWSNTMYTAISLVIFIVCRHFLWALKAASIH